MEHPEEIEEDLSLAVGYEMSVKLAFEHVHAVLAGALKWYAVFDLLGCFAREEVLPYFEEADIVAEPVEIHAAGQLPLVEKLNDLLKNELYGCQLNVEDAFDEVMKVRT